MSDYEYIERLIQLEHKVEELQRNQLSNVAFIILLIGCCLFFIGSCVCAFISAKERY